MRDEPWVEALHQIGDGVLRVVVQSLSAAERHIVAALAHADAPIVSIEPEEVTLERAFLEMTS